MRRFILTYQREGHTEEIEGIEFSPSELYGKTVALEHYPDDDTAWSGPQGFYSLEHMEYKLNEFGETSIKWLDEEEKGLS